MSKIQKLDGLPVINAKHSVKLHINKQDIAKARNSTKDPAACAIARACYRELGAVEVRVHISRVYVRTNDSNWQRYYTPGSLRREIVAFDRGGTFEPCDTSLAVIPPSELGPRQHGSSNNKKKKSRIKTKNIRPSPA